MTKSNKKKSDQLGMAIGTASGRLRKMIMFSLVRETGRDVCYRCGKKIHDIDTLSIEHITPWLDSDDPKELFFDLDNIAFSHMTCNISAKRQPRKGNIESAHGKINRYDKWGCRCPECKATKVAHNKRYQ